MPNIDMSINIKHLKKDIIKFIKTLPFKAFDKRLKSYKLELQKYDNDEEKLLRYLKNELEKNQQYLIDNRLREERFVRDVKKLYFKDKQDIKKYNIDLPIDRRTTKYQKYITDNYNGNESEYLKYIKSLIRNKIRDDKINQLKKDEEIANKIKPIIGKLNYDNLTITPIEFNSSQLKIWYIVN